MLTWRCLPLPKNSGLLADFHCHVQMWGSQRFKISRLRRMLDHARWLGLDILALTEHADAAAYPAIHDAMDGLGWQWQGLRVLAGIEVTLREKADVLLAGEPWGIRSLVARFGGKLAAGYHPWMADLLAASDDLGLIRIGAHPCCGGHALLRVEQSLLRQLDALEVNAWDLGRRGRVAAAARDLGLGLVSGSDAHHWTQLGRVANLLPDGLTTIKAIRQVLRCREVELFPVKKLQPLISALAPLNEGLHV